MNVWLVNPFDPLPGERLRPGRYAFFAKLLAEAGYMVTWWVSAFSHATKSYRDPRAWEGCLPDGVAVTMLWAPAYRHNVGARRLLNHFLWARSFYKKACAADTSPDVIISSSPPIYGSNRALRVAHRRSAKVILDIQDLWPEAFQVVFPPSLQRLGMSLLLPLRALEDANFRHASGLTAISQTLLDRALAVDQEEKARRVIPLGVDVEVYERASCIEGGRWQKPNYEFWAVYIGTVGKTYDIDTLLQAAILLRENEPKIRIYVVGGGPLLQASREKARRWGLSNVIFTGFLRLDALAQLLVQADVGLNAIATGTVSAFPSKVFDYLAAGLPVINSVKGELGAFIQKQGVGVSYEAGQPESLREAILTLYKAPELRTEMGVQARRLAREQFDRRVAYGSLLGLLEEVVSR